MTSTFFQRLLIIILLAGTIPTLWAQEYKYEIGGMAGGAFYMGDANKNTIFKGMNPAVGAVFRYNINFRWALKANLMWGQVSGKTEGMENVFPNNAHQDIRRETLRPRIVELIAIREKVELRLSPQLHDTTVERGLGIIRKNVLHTFGLTGNLSPHQVGRSVGC